MRNLLCVACGLSIVMRAVLGRSNAFESFDEAAYPTASGYLTVNQSTGARLFFAFYEALETPSSSYSIQESANQDVPILLWLQGGPGCSGMIGNFYELGPWRVGEDEALHRNPAPWNHIYGLLFLDSPVGTGFSIAPSVDDIPTDEDGIARDVYTALQGFFNLFPGFLSRPFFVTGESYAGKYAPSVAAYILNMQEDQRSITGSSAALRLAGVAIGNGLTHPIAQVPVHAPVAYFMGLIDELQKAHIDTLATEIVAFIETEKWAEAADGRTELLEHIRNVTGLATLLDVRRTSDYYTTNDGVDYLASFLNREDVQRDLLNAEAAKWEACSSVVRKRMSLDVPKSTKHLVELLLNRSVPILLYQGQFDLQDGVASTEAWMRLLQWEGLSGFYASGREVWKENGIVVGYLRSYSVLTHVVISNAGHLVPADQAYPAQAMMEGWIAGLGFLNPDTLRHGRL